MNVRRKLLVLVMTCLSLILLLMFVLLPQRGWNAPLNNQYARWCQCVDYVRNRFDLNPSAGPYFVGAADMGPYLENQGFMPVYEPVEGAVIVFPRWFGSGIDATYGHVGVVTAVQSFGDTWSLTVRGARQTVPEWTEHGCTNVSDMSNITVPMGSNHATFYTIAPKPGQLQIVGYLELSNAAPVAGEMLRARFSVQNVGQQPMLLERLTVGGRQGSTWQDPTNADFPYHRDITLAPGQVYTYEALREAGPAGGYFAEPAVQVGGIWNTIAGANRVAYTVQEVVPLPSMPDAQPVVPDLPARPDIAPFEP
jgi:hypothetical protein